MTSSNEVLQGKIDSLLLGIFGSVLPILATWVGTVIAFYFTNESYRQARRGDRGGHGGPAAVRAEGHRADDPLRQDREDLASSGRTRGR